MSVPKREIEGFKSCELTRYADVQMHIEHAQDAIVLITDRGLCMDANAAACRLLGRSRTDLMRRSLLSFTSILEQPGKGPPPHSFPTSSAEWQGWPAFQVIRPDQSRRDVECIMATDLDAHSYLVIWRDITEQKAADAQVEALAQLLQEVSPVAPVPLPGYGAAIAVIDLSHRRQAEVALQRQAQQEQALNQVIQVIRSSLDLDTIFAESAAHIAEFLSCEVSIVEYVSEQRCWIHRAVYDQGNQKPSKVNLAIPDEDNPFAAQLKRFQLVQIADTRTIEDPINRDLADAFPGSWLLTPIRVTQDLWGSLSLGRSHQFGSWNEEDIALAQRVADQLGIAIAQAHLYQQLHVELNERRLMEGALQRQTEREQRLATMTHRIRRSLNLQDILETTVCEVQAFLKTDRVLIYQLTSERGGTVVAESVEPGWISLLGFEISDPCLMEEVCLTPYLEGKVQIISDLQTAHLSPCYVEMLSGFQVRASLVLPIQEGHKVWGLLIAQHCLAPREWDEEDIIWLKRLTDQLEIAIQQSQLYEQTVLQARRETLFNEIVTTIRHSLNLDDVLRETADKLLQALQISRSMVALQSDVEDAFDYMLIATAPGVPAHQPQHLEIYTAPALRQALEGGEPLAIDEVIQEPLLDAALPLTLEMGVQSMILIAIQMDGRNKGMICVQQCDRVRRWTFSEQLLMKQVSDQLAIAIQQVELYQQVQQLNADLEHRVEERTAELHQALQFESLLKHITDKVRDSLDEQQILQTAVEELSRGLGIECCDTGLYNEDQTLSTIAYEYTRTLQPVQGISFVIAESTHPEVYPFLFKGQTCQFCDTAPNTLRKDQRGMTVLACPIMNDQKALGDLWLFKSRQCTFSDAEVRFVQQVANQCAIALRQAHLYQAVQTQVTELERLNQLKDDFLSTVSHELRTPMANIKMAIQMVEIQLSQTGALTVDGASNLDRYFNILKEECQRETQLINNLLDLTRIDSDTDPLMPISIDLRLWVYHVSEVFLDYVRNQRQHLQIDIPDNLMLVADLSYLERILMELFNNACKYTPAGESISVMARAEQDKIQLVISNSGVTIPPIECERMFDKFYRIPNNDPWKHGGTGLGLALVKKLTEKMGGRIHAESRQNQLRIILEFPNFPR